MLFRTESYETTVFAGKNGRPYLFHSTRNRAVEEYAKRSNVPCLRHRAGTPGPRGAGVPARRL